MCEYCNKTNEHHMNGRLIDENGFEVNIYDGLLEISFSAAISDIHVQDDCQLKINFCPMCGEKL